MHCRRSCCIDGNLEQEAVHDRLCIFRLKRNFSVALALCCKLLLVLRDLVFARDGIGIYSEAVIPVSSVDERNAVLAY